MGTDLTDRTAAGLLLRSVMRSVMDGADARIVDEVADRLNPSDMFQVEYMMILEAIQALRDQREPLHLNSIQNELRPKDAAGLALLVLDSLVENRSAGPDDLQKVRKLIDFLVSFRS